MRKECGRREKSGWSDYSSSSGGVRIGLHQRERGGGKLLKIGSRLRWVLHEVGSHANKICVLVRRIAGFQGISMNV